MNGILSNMFDVPVEAGDGEDPPRPLIRRLLDNPLRLRRQALGVLVVATMLAGASRLIDGWLVGFLTAALWIVVLPLALGIAAGDAFLVTYGRGRRRLLLTLVAAVIVALLSCVLLAILSQASQSRQRDTAGSVAYGVFYGVNVLGLSAMIALVIGRGGDYMSRRIDAMSNDDW